MPRWSVMEYLSNPHEPKVLVVGCGSTPQNVTMGSGMSSLTGIPCSLGRRHRHDFTIDVSPEAGADLVMDLVTFSGTELGMCGRGRFDSVVFEYPSRGPLQPFSKTHIELWINAADQLIKRGGKIIFYSGLSESRSFSLGKMSALGYRTIDISVPPDGSVSNRYGHVFCEGVKMR